jgi:hypothetical protein
MVLGRLSGDIEGCSLVDWLAGESFPCAFTSGPLAGNVGGSDGGGSIPFPARPAKETCLLLDGVVNGAACLQQAIGCSGDEEGFLRRGHRIRGSAAGSGRRAPERKR